MGKLIIFLYKIFSILLYPLLFLMFLIRIFKKKETKKSFHEKFMINEKKLQGEYIWIHAASVGEVNSTISLINNLFKKDPNIKILITTTTLSSAKVIKEKIKLYKEKSFKIEHHFLVIDSYFVVKKFIDVKFQNKNSTIGPQKILFFESEIWPNVISYAKEKSIPIYLVNARISEKTYKKWLFLYKNFNFSLFSYFDEIFVQHENDLEKFKDLTKSKVSYFGNLKLESVNKEFDELRYQKYNQILTKKVKRKVFLAASTHKKEEEIVIKAHKKLKEKFPDLLTIIAIRHPERIDEVKSLVKDLNYKIRTLDENIDIETEIYLVNSFGELPLFYKLSDITFIGGSLFEIGGHNPYEAIMQHCAIVTGKFVYNFNEIYTKLAKNNLCFYANNDEEIFKNVSYLFENEEIREKICNDAFKLIEENLNTSTKIIDRIS